jgi:histidine ammonia-lyase
MLAIQLNSSDDNPAVIAGITVPPGTPEQAAVYYVKGGDVPGAVIPTANFEPFPWVLLLESLGIALSHISRSSVQRTIRLETAHFTHLSRFLTPDESTIAYGTIQKPLLTLDAENRALSNPVSADVFPVAGEIEDIGTNAADVAQRVGKMIDNLYYILGIELMHAAQAIDLRRRANPHLSLGCGTTKLFEACRAVVPFLEHDRVMTTDITKAYHFLKNLSCSIS